MDPLRDGIPTGGDCLITFIKGRTLAWFPARTAIDLANVPGDSYILRNLITGQPQLAGTSGLQTKSSVHRHQQGILRRQQYPESEWWNTAVGSSWLKLLHHAGRGFSAQTLQVLTIIHNFDLKRADGTTAAQRLFNQTFPDLFESVVASMGDLPLPRKSSKAHRPKSLSTMLFPA